MLEQEQAPTKEDTASSDYVLGVTLRLGSHCAAEFLEASGPLDRAASVGLPAASFCLGVMYLRGEGVTQDSAKGYQLIKDAAYHNYDRAQIYLVALDILTASSKDAEERGMPCAELLQRPARTLSAADAFALGTMKIAGIVTAPDFVGGEILLRDASRKGLAMAALAIDLLDYLETPPVRAEAGAPERLTCRAARLGVITAISFLVLNFGIEAGPLPHRELLDCTEKAIARGVQSAEQFKRVLLSLEEWNNASPENNAAIEKEIHVQS